MISAIILTYNEAVHIERCLNSLKKLTDHVIVVDSFSTDKTKDICEQFDVKFYTRKWINYSDQLNWALKHTEINTDWVIRIDADEYLTPELIINLKLTLKNINENITSISVNRLMYFQEKPLKHGNMYPIKHIRIWRKSYGKCEERWMDERIKMSKGETKFVKGDLIDHNLNNISWWIAKHNKYAIREALDYFKNQSSKIELNKLNGLNRRKAKKIYYTLPPILRAVFYFLYRYIIRFGFLDGRSGFLWHFMQSFWYRILVDSIIIEVSKEVDERSNSFEEILKKRLKKL